MVVSSIFFKLLKSFYVERFTLPFINKCILQNTKHVKVMFV